MQAATGWTHEYILWGESYLNIQMKMADASYKKKKREYNVREVDDVRELEDLFE